MARLDPKFLLRYPNQEKTTEIRLRLNYEYDCFIYPLVDPTTLKVYKILPCLWDNKTQQPIPDKKISKSLKNHTANNSDIRSMIEKLKVAVSELLAYARINEIHITNEFLKEQLDIKIGKREKKVAKELTLCTFYDTVIEEMKNGKLLTDNTEKYNKGTIKSHQRTLLLLKEFDISKNQRTKFENIGNIWYDAFVLFLTFEYENIDNGFAKDNYTPDTIGKHIKNLKMIMALAINRKISSNREYEQKYFTKPKGSPFSVYLNEDEIRKIYDVNLTGEHIELDIHRDMFLIGCYTALRISDYTNIKPENFKRTAQGTDIIDIPTLKTKVHVQVPIVYDEVFEIAQKYNYIFPKVYTQDLNDAIKKVAELAGITDLITYKRTKGGITENVIEPKWKLISSHTGRRSAATNFYNIYNIPEMNIMFITGHKTTENFRKYIKIDAEQNADKISKQIREYRDGQNSNTKGNQTS